MPITHPDYSNINAEEMAASIGLKAKHIPMLIGSFLEEALPLLETLQRAIESKDYTTIRHAAHSIKGSAGNLRFTEVYDMAKELEFAGAESNESFDFQGYLDAISQAIKTIKI